MISWNFLKNRFAAALLFGAVSVQSAFAAPVLAMTATPNPAVPGSTVEIDVAIADITDLSAYQFTLSFDAAMFQVIGGTEGAFLATGGTTIFDAGTIDNTAGTVSYAFGALIGPIPGVNGSGSLAHFSLNVLKAGSGVFALSDVLFLDSSMGDLTVLPVDLTVTAATPSDVPEPSALWLFGVGLAAFGVMRRRA